MKRSLFLFWLAATTLLLSPLYAQKPDNGRPVRYSMKRIRAINDSIVKEADLLYRYERAAWIGTDLAFAHERIRFEIQNYIVYQTDDTIRTVFTDSECRAVMSILSIGPHSEICAVDTVRRALSEQENKLLDIKLRMLDKIAWGEIDIECPTGYSLNHILIPDREGYRFYVLTGTFLQKVIPLGNDRLFRLDRNGEIVSSRKYHSQLIPMNTDDRNDQQNNVTGLLHSHLKHEPFISPTDICTFRLYGPYYAGMRKLVVYSTALRRFFIYDLNENTISIGPKIRAKAALFRPEASE